MRENNLREEFKNHENLRSYFSFATLDSLELYFSSIIRRVIARVIFVD